MAAEVTGGRGEAAVPTVEAMLARLGIDWGQDEPEELAHNRRLTPGVWRVRAGDGQPAVLKYLRADRDPGQTRWDAHWTAEDHEPSRWNYWAREPLAYQHGLIDIYAEAGIHAPVCLRSHVDDREALLLLEWVDGQPGESWPVSLYGSAAEALGHAQARFLLGDPLPAFPWLSRRFLRRGQVVLIDWAFVGVGSIGEDVGNLVPDACFDHFASAEDLPELEQVIFAGHLRGLRAAGWNDDPRLMQLGMWASAVKYDWLTPLTLAQVRQDRQHRYGGEGAIDAAFKFRQRSKALLFLAGWARKAIEMANRLGV